ncbi:MAG: rod shape-determining protein MreD [Pseudomonadota bacterium]
MKLTFWQRLDVVVRALFPCLITLMLVVASALPLPAPSLSHIMPMLPLIAVFYWAVYKPDLFPLWAVFLIGLVQDLLSGGPIGVSAIAFLSLQAAVNAQRRRFVSASFAKIWLLFSIFSAAAFALMWLLISFSMMLFVDPMPLLFQFLLTVAVYPCFAWLMVRGQRAFER